MVATLLDGKLYVKIFSMLYVDCSNGHVVLIVKNHKCCCYALLSDESLFM